MNKKAIALELVNLQASSYYDISDEKTAQHGRLVDAINKARVEGGATQQEIANATVVGEHSLSRQRIAQLLED